MKPVIKSKHQIENIRKACRLASRALDEVTFMIREGITTEELDTFLHDFIVKNRATPAPLNYKGYPRSTCISVNDVICHGIPSKDVVLKKGDILNIDVTVILDGFYGDTSRMFCVGGIENLSPVAHKLIEVTEMAMYEGIRAIKDGAYVNDIGIAIENYVRKTETNFQIVREFTGHGTGLSFHEPPQVFHFNTGKTGVKLKAGMVITVEPMINAGHWKSKFDDDGWTARTIDGSLSAQWEHTVLVTSNGFEILSVS
ncbi:MAG: type I methionyl aminopeptidase [Deltaproteobacteria bacterium]|nr:type I methionyl aminopeptidase [Deltaproteobacteria bacterium]